MSATVEHYKPSFCRWELFEMAKSYTNYPHPAVGHLSVCLVLVFVRARELSCFEQQHNYYSLFPQGASKYPYPLSPLPVW